MSATSRHQACYLSTAQLGKWAKSTPSTTFPSMYIGVVMRTTPIMFSPTPDLAISAIRICPVPKIIALGGVATGSIKAQEQDSVPGIMRKSGLMRIWTARAAISEIT